MRVPNWKERAVPQYLGAVWVFLFVLGVWPAHSHLLAQGELELTLRSYPRTDSDLENRIHFIQQQTWPAERTAVIVCDMWDLHHCLNATRRVGELAPRMNQFLHAARDQGAVIIHAPSSCMEAYAQHPGRALARSVPPAPSFPPQIEDWCYSIDSEHRDAYPIDQSDGGEDDDLEEHRQWARQLASLGRDPKAPWKSEVHLIDIEEGDYIGDDGQEIWSILEHNDINNVMLVGVHTNMCVLGRPFGLRQMAKNGKNVVLVRDLTDTMYNPAMPPFVSHFTGTDYIVDYIEHYVCPTITSDQLLGGKPFRFSRDSRPRLAIVLSEPEYDTDKTVPKFGRERLGPYFSVTVLHADPADGATIPHLDQLDDADIALFSIRRRLLPDEDLEIVRRFIERGKPVVGIRTSSHAFTVREGEIPAGRGSWPEFDHDVWGGHYTNHLGEGPAVQAVVPGEMAHPILSGLRVNQLQSHGSLYKVLPLRDSTSVVLNGSVPGHEPEPAAWTHVTKYGGRAFYTSFGHRDDFENPEFQKLLVNGLCWAAGIDLPDWPAD
jgi:nicotinamidase-related amidase